MEVVKTIVEIVGIIAFIGMCIIVLAPSDFSNKK
jgi:hypothetical protein